MSRYRWTNNSPPVECVRVWRWVGEGVEDPFKVSFYNASDERMGFPFVQCFGGIGFELPRTISSTLPSVVFVKGGSGNWITVGVFDSPITVYRVPHYRSWIELDCLHMRKHIICSSKPKASGATNKLGDKKFSTLLEDEKFDRWHLVVIFEMAGQRERFQPPICYIFYTYTTIKFISCHQIASCRLI